MQSKQYATPTGWERVVWGGDEEEATVCCVERNRLGGLTAVVRVTGRVTVDGQVHDFDRLERVPLRRRPQRG